MGLIKNIKERRLFQIVAAYAAAGFVVLEGVDQLVQNEVLPDFAYPLTLWWYGFGFIAALIVGWFHGEKGVQRAPLLEIAALSILGMAVLAFTGVQVASHVADREARAAAAASELDLHRIAVTYFEDLSPGRESVYLADAFTEELIAELSQVRALDVISRNGVARFRENGVSVDSIARGLQAGTVVTGTVEEIRDMVRVNVRIHDGLSGTEFRRVSLERPSEEILTARDAVIEETARSLREWLGEEITVRRRQVDAEDRAAWALLQRAERERKEAERLLHEEGVEAAFAGFDRADELLERAETVDPAWVEPIVLRGEIAFRRSRLDASPPSRAEPWIRTGLEHAERALSLTPNLAEALALRGTLRYWWYLLPLIDDGDERAATLRQARADLEQAVRLDPTLAGAHYFLSHLYAWIDQMSSSVLAARRAYEEDAYLETADRVLWSLVTGNYDLESFEEASRWCREGVERFPRDHRFARCQLVVMTTGVESPDVDRAWELVERVEELAPEPERPLQTAVSLVHVGGVLARANLPDSADAVLRRARDSVGPHEDSGRDVILLEAAMRATVLGDVDGSIDLLKEYAVANPGYDFGHHWWWRSVRAHPRYDELTAFQVDH